MKEQIFERLQISRRCFLGQDPCAGLSILGVQFHILAVLQKHLFENRLELLWANVHRCKLAGALVLEHLASIEELVGDSFSVGAVSSEILTLLRWKAQANSKSN